MISLIDTLSISLLLVAGLFVLGRTSAEVGRRVSDAASATVHWTGTLLAAYSGLAVAGALSIWGLGAAGATVGAVPSATGSLVANALVAALVALVGVAAVHRGLAPLPSSLGAGFTTRPRQWRARLVVDGAAVFALALVVQAYRFALVPGEVWLVVAGFIGVVFGRALVLSYWRHLAPVVSRLPTDGERARLEAAFERFGGTCPPVEVTVRERIASPVFVSGHGPFRRLVVRESWLEGVTDDDLAVALSQTDAANRRWYIPHLILYSSVVWSFYLVSLYGVSGVVGLRAGPRPIAERAATLGVLALLTLVLVLAARQAKRITYAADAETADEFGPEAVVATYERSGSDLVSFRNGEPGQDRRSDAPGSGHTGRLSGMKYRMRPAPSMAHRLEHLRQSHDVGEAEPRVGDSSADGTTDSPADVDGDRTEAREETTPSRSEEVGEAGPSRWWVAVATPLVVIAGMFAASAIADGLHAAGVFATSPRESYIDALVPAFLLTSLVAPFGVYRERARAGAVGWRPSRVYYLTAVPLLNVFVAAVYVVRRRTAGTSS
ncbi:hypothetical protein [Halosimplex sp. J119]